MPSIIPALRALRQRLHHGSTDHDHEPPRGDARGARAPRPSGQQAATPAMFAIAAMLLEREERAVALGAAEPHGSPEREHWFACSEIYGEYAARLRQAAETGQPPQVVHRIALRELQQHMGMAHPLVRAEVQARSDVLLLLWVSFQMARPNGHDQPDDHIGADILLDLAAEPGPGEPMAT